MDNLDLILASSLMTLQISKIKLSLDEIKEKHPNRIDLIESMENTIKDLETVYITFKDLEIEYRVTRQRAFDLEKIITNEKNRRNN